MAAYTCVISLLQTLEQLQQRNPYFAKLFDSLHASAQYFKLVLDETSCKTGRFDPQKIKSLEEKIRVAASDAEDAVALEISQILQGVNLRYAIEHSRVLHSRLLPIVERMDALTKHVMKMVSDFDMIRISTSGGDGDSDDDDEILEFRNTLISTSTSNCPMLNLEDHIVQGLDDDLEIIVERLTGPVSHLDIVTITGMGGIGKTTLAKKAHDHLAVRYHFDIRVWVTISAEFQSRNVLLDALHCISNLKKNNYDKKDDNELADLMQKSLKGRRYLFVVDDIWSTDVWDSIRRIFPDNNNRSRILLTSRQTTVATYASPTSPHKMNLLNLDNGWKLLRDKVFGPNHDHPPRLEEIGKEIVKKCQGLPLTITVIAGHLSKMRRTSKSWENVAQVLGKIIATHPDKCLGVFGLSYHHLPNHLKPCFLYIGGFPEDFQIETWRLIQLWIAEGFVSTSGGPKSLENVGEDYLEDLVSRNLIMVRKRRFNGEIRSCAVHDLLREFCLMEAKVTKFMHVERTHVPTLQKQKHNVRRFSFQTNCTVDHCSKRLPRGARSIYIFHQLQPYQHSAKRRIFSLRPPPSILGFPALAPPPPIFEVFSHFNLLRVLAISFNKFFYSFPHVITTLFHLRYLEFRCYANLPASISKLQNLQTLIYDHNRTTAPREIWMMKNLRHIDLGRSCYFPNPESIGNKHLVTGMPNLVKLSTICSSSCTNEVFSGIPNIKILSVEGCLSGEGRNHLYDMSSLTKLEALELSKIAFLRNSIKRFVFPTSLKRLTLGCLYLSWEDISTLVMLPNLEELKLNRAVGGRLWRLTDEDKFQNLKLLVFCGINIQMWEASSDSFPNLERLVLKHCKKLQEIPTDFGEICTLESLELHNCCTCAEDSARAIEQEQKEMGNTSLKVYIHNDDNTSKIYSSGDCFLATSGSSGNSHLSVTARDDTCLNGEILPTPDLKIYSFSDLKLATKNFKSDSVLGIGGFGTVYKGWVDEKTGSRMTVAITKLNADSFQGFEEWQSEVNFLGRLSHPNLVKLLGYCREDEELLLVYEFMEKGSLENHLFRRRAAIEPLSWDLRLKIAIGAARGLAFLHTSENKVIYRDFKASNILLDGNYNAKISDFGLAKLGPSHVTTRIMGTYGYADPEYLATGHLYVKSDVYGFGVVLLEILTGLRALDTNRPSGQHYLAAWVKPMLLDERKMKSIMDARMEGQYSSKAVMLAAQITLKCLRSNPENRPSMKKVMGVLEQIEAIKENPKANQTVLDLMATDNLQEVVNHHVRQTTMDSVLDPENDLEQI